MGGTSRGVTLLWYKFDRFWRKIIFSEADALFRLSNSLVTL